MIRYEGNISYNDSLKADFTAGIIFGALKLRLIYVDTVGGDSFQGGLFQGGLLQGGLFQGGLFLFGRKIKTIEQIEEMLDSRGRDSDKAEPDNMNSDKKNSDNRGSDNTDSENAGLDKPDSDKNDSGETVNKILKKILTRVKDIFNKIRVLYHFIVRYSNDDTKAGLINALKKILRQLFPREIKGDIKFGLEDPYYTGKILEVLAILYAETGDNLRVEPVWDVNCFSGKVSFSGKIYITVVLWNLLKIKFIKNKIYKKEIYKK